MNSRFLLFFFFSSIILTACGHNVIGKPDLEDAKYWQRSDATSALYLQGSKAQQQLHIDISECVVKIRELDKLGALRRAVPAEYGNGEPLDQWNSPERDGYLYAEHVDYHDFETCMNAKGWERVEYLPYDAAALARQNYIDGYGSKRKSKNRAGRENVTTVHQGGTSAPTFNN